MRQKQISKIHSFTWYLQFSIEWILEPAQRGRLRITPHKVSWFKLFGQVVFLNNKQCLYHFHTLHKQWTNAWFGMIRMSWNKIRYPAFSAQWKVTSQLVKFYFDSTWTCISRNSWYAICTNHQLFMLILEIGKSVPWNAEYQSYHHHPKCLAFLSWNRYFVTSSLT